MQQPTTSSTRWSTGLVEALTRVAGNLARVAGEMCKLSTSRVDRAIFDRASSWSRGLRTPILKKRGLVEARDGRT